MVLNKLGHYIYKRICKEQELFRKTRHQNNWGLYIQPKDIQRYIGDYLDYGIDYMGEDNMSSEDFIEYQINEPGAERYWDEADGKEE